AFQPNTPFHAVQSRKLRLPVDIRGQAPRTKASILSAALRNVNPHSQSCHGSIMCSVVPSVTNDAARHAEPITMRPRRRANLQEPPTRRLDGDERGPPWAIPAVSKNFDGCAFGGGGLGGRVDLIGVENPLDAACALLPAGRACLKL